MSNETVDVQIGRLDERLRALDKKVDATSGNILNEIRELKENIAGRLRIVETAKLAASDFITNKAEVADSFNRSWTELKNQKNLIDNIKDRQMYWAGGLMVMGLIVGLLAPILLNRYLPSNKTANSSIVCVENKVIINCP